MEKKISTNARKQADTRPWRQHLKGKSQSQKGEEKMGCTITKEGIDALIDMGAKRWTKGDHDRLYLTRCGAEIIGLGCEYYNTGNIRSAELGGEKISNCEARRIEFTYSDAYINLKTGGIGGLKGRTEHQDLFRKKLLDYLQTITG